jgi:dTDP-4-amino-4,6-dideoxygalactose transaminase
MKYYVTQPTLPPFDEFVESLREIWESKTLTNNGKFHQELEKRLAEFLGVKYISLFANGTLALISALQVLKIGGEVITTPFSFVATTHALWWNGISPVFVDIEPDFYNIDPNKIESAITPRTSAILPVHVYGNPCNIQKIQEIADIYGLKVIYDAAHAFGVTQDNNSILNFGDLSILSFHATKTYNTIEGGAIICHDEKTKKRIDYLKNFGFANETTVVAPGINAKMNELQAAYGLLQLNGFEEQRLRRQKITQTYCELLKGIDGIRFQHELENVKHNYSYFPILIDEKKIKLTRDELYDKLKENDIYSRKYFYPLISDFPTYRNLPSSKTENLPIAKRIANNILCLPIYADLPVEIINKIVQIIQQA